MHGSLPWKQNFLASGRRWLTSSTESLPHTTGGGLEQNKWTQSKTSPDCIFYLLLLLFFAFFFFFCFYRPQNNQCWASPGSYASKQQQLHFTFPSVVAVFQVSPTTTCECSSIRPAPSLQWFTLELRFGWTAPTHPKLSPCTSQAYCL